MRKSSWFQPLLAGLLGIAVLVAASLGGHTGRGIAGLVALVAFGLILAAGGRSSETLRALRGDGRDERFEMMRLQAASLAARVVLIAVVVLFLIQVARGHSGTPYSWLSALGGGTFLVTIGVLRWRS